MRKLGARGPTVSSLGLGCMGMSDSYGVPDDRESLATIERALKLGINFFDTADAYGPFVNEALLGRAIKKRRDKVVLATKAGFLTDDRGMVLGIDGSPGHIKDACDASLRRLGVDAIDLFYLHRVDPRIPIEVTMGAMAELVDQGKVRHLGLSEVSPETLRKAHDVYPITAVQSEYSIWSREPEDGILETCEELGVGFVAYSPLGCGFLTGKIRSVVGYPQYDVRRSYPRFQQGTIERNLLLLDHLELVAKAKGCTLAQLSLAWVLAKGSGIVPIVGTKKRKYLDEDVRAVDVRLSPSDLKDIEEAFPKASVAGERYPPEGMAAVDR